LEKYRFEQSLEHTSKFIEQLEKELEDYQKHVELFKKREGAIAEEISNEDTDGDDLTSSSDTE
jgi:glutaredoxin 2